MRGPSSTARRCTLLEAHRLIAPEEPAQVRVLPATARFARPTLRTKEPGVSVTVLHPAPVGRPERFRLHRAGLIGLYEYEDETFEFERGRLLLRGPNGSGKSKALELLLPLLLDGELRRRAPRSIRRSRTLDALEPDRRPGVARAGGRVLVARVAPPRRARASSTSTRSC